MTAPSPSVSLAVPLAVLAIGQLIAWGVAGLPVIAAPEIGADLGLDLPAVFAGTTAFYIAMGLCAPLLEGPFNRFGPRALLIAGTIATAPAFVALGFCEGPVGYFGAWIAIGACGSATMTTATYILLNSIAGRRARSAIGALMLVTGLSGTVFVPLGSWLVDTVGWRGTCTAYACILLLVTLPMYLFLLPAGPGGARGPAAAETGAAPEAAPSRATFALVVAAIVLNAFVTYGFASILLELLKHVGLPEAEAVSWTAALGVLQVGARAVDFAGGGRWDGITTAIIAGVVLPASMLLLLAGGSAHWSIVGFVLLYGLASGALAVARATIPLVFYDKRAYVRAVSRIALPLNVISALSPPILAGFMTWGGTALLLTFATSLSLCALVLLVILAGRRPVQTAAQPGA